MMRALLDIKNGKFSYKNHQALCVNEDGETIVDGTQEKYLVDLLKIEPLDELSKLKIPVLVLQGTSDFIIAPSEFDLARKALNSKSNLTCQLLEGIDHIMSEQKDRKSSLHAMMEIEKTKVFAPLAQKLSNSIADWLSGRK